MSQKNIVLYADDDADDILLVRDAFHHYTRHVELVTVEDGLEALAYLKNISTGHEPLPCLIILDINMPKMDGKEALIKIRAMHQFDDVPAILFTTSSQNRDKDFARKYNAGFITKPIDVTQMEFIARKFIEHCSDKIKKEISAEIS